MPREQGRKRSWAGRGGIANKGGKSSQKLENISQTDIPEAPPPSSQGDMPMGGGCKHSWAGQGGIADKGGKSSQQLQNISQTDILEPSPPPSQVNMPRGNGRKHSWADRGGIVSRGGKSSQQLQTIFQTNIPEPPPPSSQGNMPWGQGRKRIWADRGGIANRGGKSSQQLQTISQTDISEPHLKEICQGEKAVNVVGQIEEAEPIEVEKVPNNYKISLRQIFLNHHLLHLKEIFQGEKGRKRSWADLGGIANRGGKSSQQLQNIIQTVIAELSSPSSQGVDSYHALFHFTEVVFNILKMLRINRCLILLKLLRMFHVNNQLLHLKKLPIRRKDNILPGE